MYACASSLTYLFISPPLHTHTRTHTRTHTHTHTCTRTHTHQFQDPFTPAVNYSLSLLLRSEPTVVPSTLLIFNHPDNRNSLTIFNGSSYFRIDHAVKPRLPVADVEYIKEFQRIDVSTTLQSCHVWIIRTFGMSHVQIHPLGEGLVKVTVTDLCLAVADTMATVYVSSLYTVQVLVADKVGGDGRTTVT